ncbi:Uncharacterised protein [Yersinia rohdei]|uniref:DUF2163 domain-containing protein n=1 Tax=Yersinia rohdei TaxID=29485 RepID=A0A0U1HUP6_YERRO|nr:hypothetical protein [Yersinia rohdei]CQI92546.1 Uncharacterised protein [Yersinia rohdei]
MNTNILTNPDLIQYWNITRGDNKTILTQADVYQLNVIVKCLDIIPTSNITAPIYLTDSWVNLTANGIVYTSAPDFIDDSFSTMTEKNTITNNGTSFKVSNVEQTYLSLLSQGLLFNAKINIYLTILNPANGNVISHDRMFSGYINNFESTFSQDGTKNETTVNLNSVWKKLDRSQPVLSSTSIHQSQHMGDKFFDLIGVINSTQQWKN